MPGELEPYVGFSSFAEDDQEIFFGRQREVSDLLSLVIAHQAVLLYAESGAGKTSLINAGLIPSLRQEGLEVLLVAAYRVSSARKSSLRQSAIPMCSTASRAGRERGRARPAG